MGNIRSFGGIKKIVLYFDYYYSSARFFFYKVMQLGGRFGFSDCVNDAFSRILLWTIFLSGM